MLNFTDTHCHLDDKSFSATLPLLLEKCVQENIKRIIVPSTSPQNFRDVLALKNLDTNKLALFPCLGIHPWYLNDLNDEHLAQLENTVSKERKNIIAIGETGLDGVISKNASLNNDNFASDASKINMIKQQHFFDFQLGLAKQHQLPVIIHHRQSHQLIIPMLKRYQLPCSGVIHGFSGSYQQAVDYINLGYKIGVGGTITYPRANKTINAIKRLPLSALVLETDAPSMPLNIDYCLHQTDETTTKITDVNRYRNSPLNVKQVFKALVEHRQESAWDIAEQLEKNVNDIFFSHI
jgi:TatD DNase family protein